MIKLDEIGLEKELKKHIEDLETKGDDGLKQYLEKARLFHEQGDYDDLKKLLLETRRKRRELIIEDLKGIIKQEVPLEYPGVYNLFELYTSKRHSITSACNILHEAIRKGKWKPTADGKKLLGELGEWSR